MTQVLWPAINFPTSSRPAQPSFGGHDDIVANRPVTSQGACDETLVMPDVRVIETIDVGGVEQGDSSVYCCSDDTNTLLFRRPIPDGEVHSPVADRRDRDCMGPEFSLWDHWILRD